MGLIYEKFEQGEIVRLDKNFRNTSLVKVEYQTKNRMFTTISVNNSSWDVMTNRLSKISNNEKAPE